MKNKKPVTFVFIDASNLMYGASTVGWKIDYKKLAVYLKTRFDANRLFYYAGVDKQNSKQIGFYKKLRQFGYELQLVPLKIFANGKKKADVDSRLTVEAIKYASSYNKALFITGDGDYYWLFEYLLSQKKRLKLLAFYHNTAKELKKLFGPRFTNLEELKKILEFNKKAADTFEGSTADIMTIKYHRKGHLSRR